MPLLVLLVVLAISAGCEKPRHAAGQQRDSVRVEQRMGAEPDPGFTRAMDSRVFSFPRDHGPHDDFATEWWYFTGNLRDAGGARFGYQLTLFRVGLKPGRPIDDSTWRASQIYMGHFALSDVRNRQHHSSERFSRSAAGLAGATTHPLNVWLGPWSIRGGGSEIFPLELRASTDNMDLSLTLLKTTKPLVLQGDSGLSRKGGLPGNASYYYSYTRLPTRGEIQIDGKRHDVSGNSWFDHEWSSSALGPDQAGWDWFALHLDDGRDLMFYRMRGKDGRMQRFSSGVLVEPDGQTSALSHAQVQLRPTRLWTTGQGTGYPVAWSLKVPDHALDLQIEAAFDDQEMPLSVRYWEGAIDVRGSHGGVGYLELSGYAR